MIVERPESMSEGDESRPPDEGAGSTISPVGPGVGVLAEGKADPLLP